MSATPSRPAAGVTYQPAGKGYFEKRGLSRFAGAWSLWALGVGAVISGDFFGWNFGLAVGGFGGLFIATIIIAIMYLGLAFSIAEMSPALPHTGGAYSFARTTMGPWGGFITGLAENMEYVLAPAVVVVGIAGYMSAITLDIFGFTLPNPVWWAVFYAIFVGLNVLGAAITFRFTIVITLMALAVLAIFWIGAIPHFDFARFALNIGMSGEPVEGNGPWLPFGLTGIAAALPFAIWFYLAIEQLPLAAEESHDPARDMPRGLTWGILTLIAASLLTLFLSAGISPGAAEVGASSEPLFLAFKTIFGDGAGSALLALVAVVGLIASFHTIIYAYGRNIYSLSRAGYFPKILSITHTTRKTPYVALISGAAVGYVVCLLLEYGAGIFGNVPVGPALLSMAVFGAVIAYIMQMLAYIRLKSFSVERPYVSPFGIPGAAIAAIIAAVTFVCLFLNADYRPGLYGCAIWFALGLVYFAVYARHHLVLSPEEAFAEQHRA